MNPMSTTEFQVVAAPSSQALITQAAPAELVSAEVVDDVQAIRIFIAGYKHKSSHTTRAYEKECYRFLLWLRLKRGAGHAHLPAVGIDDMNVYMDFVREPRPFNEEFLKANGWDHQPFRNALSKTSIALCITVLHRLFTAMREMRGPGGQPYCTYNPVKLLHEGLASRSNQDDEVEQALTEIEWGAVQEVIEGLPQGTEREKKHYHRARWIMQLLYRAFLRREEAANLKMGNFIASPQGWSLRFVGKGDKSSTIIVTSKLIDELKVYRTSLGLPALPSPGESRPAIMAVTGVDKGVTGQAIYLICKEIFGWAADLIEGSDNAAAARLRQSSPHWMRHTGVSHSMEMGVDPRYVQAQARHSSLNITARYDHKKRQAWRDAFNAADNSKK